MVEEIGEVAGDKEDYGEYQKDRIDTREGGTAYWDWGDDEDLEEIEYRTNGRFNEYAEAREAPGWRM